MSVSEHPALNDVATFPLFEGFSRDEIQSILLRTKSRTAEPNEVICGQGEVGKTMYLIISGRIKIVRNQPDGSEKILNYLERGEHFGELSVFIGGRRSATAVALVNTEMLEMNRDEFWEIMGSFPRFAANISRTLSMWLREQAEGPRPEPFQSIVLFRTSKAVDQIAFQMVSLWRRTTGKLTIFTDRADAWNAWLADAGPAVADKTGRVIIDSVAPGETIATPATSADEKFLVDVGNLSGFDDVLGRTEQVWIAMAPDDFRQALKPVQDLMARHGLLEERTRILWCYDDKQHPPTELRSSAISSNPAICLGLQKDAEGNRRLGTGDTQRMLHHLQRVEIGLALGGGGGRGLAHLGVLKAFDEHGLQFDRIAGTSVGALAAVFYAAGIQPEETLKLVTGDMTPPRAIRWLPKHKQWFMLLAFRTGMLERKFRAYLRDLNMEEMFSPLYTVCVDLIQGCAVIRESGDAVRAALESINHPGMGCPILGAGEALVDGGVLINLPADLLRKRGCNYVVAVDIGAQLRPSFAGNTPETLPGQMKKPGYFETLFRVTEVQMCSLAELHSSDCDFLITPATAQFPFEDFTRGRELFEVGYQAGIEAIPRLRQEIANATNVPKDLVGH